MYGINEQEEYGFYESVILAWNQHENYKVTAAEALNILAERAKELIAQHEKAIKEYYEKPL